MLTDCTCFAVMGGLGVKVSRCIVIYLGFWEPNTCLQRNVPCCVTLGMEEKTGLLGASILAHILCDCERSSGLQYGCSLLHNLAWWRPMCEYAPFVAVVFFLQKRETHHFTFDASTVLCTKRPVVNLKVLTRPSFVRPPARLAGCICCICLYPQVQPGKVSLLARAQNQAHSNYPLLASSTLPPNAIRLSCNRHSRSVEYTRQ